MKQTINSLRFQRQGWFWIILIAVLSGPSAASTRSLLVFRDRLIKITPLSSSDERDNYLDLDPTKMSDTFLFRLALSPLPFLTGHNGELRFFLAWKNSEFRDWLFSSSLSRGERSFTNKDSQLIFLLIKKELHTMIIYALYNDHEIFYYRLWRTQNIFHSSSQYSLHLFLFWKTSAHEANIGLRSYEAGIRMAEYHG